MGMFNFNHRRRNRERRTKNTPHITRTVLHGCQCEFDSYEMSISSRPTRQLGPDERDEITQWFLDQFEGNGYKLTTTDEVMLLRDELWGGQA